VSYAGDRKALASPTVRRVVNHVLDRERCGSAALTVTFMSAARMRAMNRRSLGRDRSTDVIAFGMRHGERVVGDMYVCPALARRFATRHGVSVRQELVRLVVHGTLHVLGYDHPDDETRTGSAMWRLQEQYVTQLVTPGVS
jgi:probable rRNA maturation factor